MRLVGRCLFARLLSAMDVDRDGHGGAEQQALRVRLNDDQRIFLETEAPAEGGGEDQRAPLANTNGFGMEHREKSR